MNYKKVKDLPLDMRPQEKLLEHGAQRLSNAELIALVIRTGSQNKSSIGVAQDIIDLGLSKTRSTDEDGYYGLKFLVNASVEDLTEIEGIGISKAVMILASVELGRRISRGSAEKREKITDTSKLPNIVMDEMRHYQEEHFKIAILNTKKELEYIETISIGSLDRAIVEPREVFYKAIKRKAHTIILLHNHPSGDPTPSLEDIEITKRLKEIGDLLSIPVIDHIVIGDGKYFSFLREGIF